MIRILVAGLLIILFSGQAMAQDTLPRFTVTTRGVNKIFVSWTNTYKTISQISIQRSIDSTKNFKTILTVPDPKVPQNGFVDTKATTPFMFYRIFVVLDSGKYVFSPSKRPVWDTARVSITPKPANGNKRVVVSETMPSQDVQELKEKLQEKSPEPEKFFIVKKNDSIVASISEKDFKTFRDSIVYKTKDTLMFKSIDTILVKIFIPKEVYKASQYVYTEKDGNVAISLPDALKKNYSIRFFDEDNTEIFEIQQVKDSLLILDKANFLHAGWFRFEIFEEGKLKEKHRLFIPKDF